MKVIKRICFVLIIVAVLIGSGFFAFEITNQQRMKKIVNSGLLTIDQEMHEWGTCKKNSPVKISLYLRNKSQIKIDGSLVIAVTLSEKGFEEHFINEFINCYGESNLRKEFEEEIRNKGSIGRLEAIYNYIVRGKKLQQGYSFEPIISDSSANYYAFKFRKQLSLQPGELVKIDHEEQIPLKVRGQILSIAVEAIEF